MPNNKLPLLNFITEKERGTVRPRVREILADYPEARNDDDILTRIYLERYHGLHLTDEQYSALKSAPPIESICRRRRDIQNTDGEFLPTQSVGQRRKIASAANQEMYSTIR